MKLRAHSIAFLLAASIASAQTAPVDLVHPLVGTQDEGQTYPAAGVPFAMTHWTPQTRAGETKCISPYYFTDAKIQGLRGSHFISGSCVPDYGSMTVMAGTGPVLTDAVARASSFRRDNEHSSPYEYSVQLDDRNVTASVTGTLRSGIMQFRFNQDSQHGWLVFENNARAGEGLVQLQGNEVTGEIPVRREYAGSGKPAGFSGHFIFIVDRQPATHGTYVGSKLRPNSDEQRGDNMAPGVITVAKMMTSTGGASAAAKAQPTSSPRPGFGAYLDLGPVKAGDIVTIRIGTSFTTTEAARANLTAEIGNSTYTAVRDKARAAWQNELTRITIPTSDPAATIFYTAMYHALLHPRTYSDVSGAYPRFHSTNQIEHAKGWTYYDDFSLWDTFRSQHPLLTIIDTAHDADMMRSLVAKGEQGGYLPIFPAWNSYTSEMVGDHATPTLIDAWRKGIRSFNLSAAYALMRKNATEIPDAHDTYIDGLGRRGLTSYLKLGYIPVEDHIDDAFHKNEQVSRTLEYAYDDGILAGFAKDLRKPADAAHFSKQGESWRNVINPATGFADGRHQDGAWLNADPTKHQTWITEGVPFQYTFFVPQNVPGLIDYLGGKAAFTHRLDDLFAKHLYEHGNEPSHHIAYLYNVAGEPSKTQQQVRSIMESEYHDGPGGLAGNDDAGQMSAWYVMSAMGLYQVTPGIPTYSIGSPRFDRLIVRLASGKTLRILADGASSGKVYVRRVTLNGTPLNNWTITHSQLESGGTLRFDMSAEPVH